VYYAGWEYACGTCTSVTFTGLSVGDTYNFFIYAHNHGSANAIPAYGLAAGTNTVTASDPTCSGSQICVSVDGCERQRTDRLASRRIPARPRVQPEHLQRTVG